MSAWYELVVSGPEDALRGFIAGCEAAQTVREGAVLGRDLDLEPSRFSQHLQELFDVGTHHLVFAGVHIKDALVVALKARGAEAGLRLEDVREVTGVRIGFSAEAFSREVADKIKTTLLTGLPPGVVGEAIEEHEEIDPKGRGGGLYAPEHSYTYTAKGTFTGPLPGIIEIQRRARSLPFVKVRPLELETTEFNQGGPTAE